MTLLDEAKRANMGRQILDNVNLLESLDKQTVDTKNRLADLVKTVNEGDYTEEDKRVVNELIS